MIELIEEERNTAAAMSPILVRGGCGIDLQRKLNDITSEIEIAGLLLRSVIAPTDAIKHFEKNAPQFLACLKAWLVRNGQGEEL